MVQSPWNVVRLELPLDAATFDGTLRADAAVNLQVAAARGDDASASPAYLERRAQLAGRSTLR